MSKDDERKSPQTGVAIFLAIFIFILCAGASVLISVYQRDLIDSTLASLFKRAKHAEAKQEPQQAPKKSTGRPILSVPAALTSPTVVFPEANFSMAEAFAATDFCALLQPALPEMKLAWKTNLLFSATSECSGELTVARAAGEQSSGSLFVQIRRNRFGASTAVRLKLVTSPAQTESQFRQKFEQAAGVLLDRLLQGGAAEMIGNIAKLQPFTLQARGMEIRLFEEKLLPGAYNLTVEAQCGKFSCPTTTPYYKLNLPAQTSSTQDGQPGAQQD